MALTQGGTPKYSLPQVGMPMMPGGPMSDGGRVLAEEGMPKSVPQGGMPTKPRGPSIAVGASPRLLSWEVKSSWSSLPSP